MVQLCIDIWVEINARFNCREMTLVSLTYRTVKLAGGQIMRRSNADISWKILRYMKAGKWCFIPADLRDIFFCIIEENGSDLVWLLRRSLQHSLHISKT